jgi:multiple sugar transport system substrate-binding protein
MRSARTFLTGLVILIVVVVAVGVPALTASVSAQEQVTLRFANWVSAEEASRAKVETVIAAFEAENPNIKIENIPIPFDQVRQQLITMSAGGNPPDIMLLNGAWPFELGGMGALIDLNTLASQEYLADNWEGGLQAGTYEGKLYAIPQGMTPHGFWWNKKLFEQAGLDPNSPPKTMDELNQVMATLKEKLPSDVYAIGIDTTKIDYALTGFWPWILTTGARPMYNGDYDFTTPQVEEAFSWLQMVAKDGYTPIGQQIKDERELMAKDKVVTKLDGPYLVGILRSLNPDLEGQAFYDTFAVTTVPEGGNGEPVTLADLHQIGISSQTKHPDMAWKFIEYFCSSDVAVKEYTIPMGMIPPLKSAATKYADLLSDPVSQAYLNEILPSMIGGPYDPQYGAAAQFVIQAMQEVAVAGAPVDASLQSLTQNLKILYRQ